jgi:hypothetical protein
MPWRVIAHDGQVWHVDAIAERRPHMESWQLALSFRTASSPRSGEASARQTIWTIYPLEATSKSSLFLQAERIPDGALSQVLADRLK